jgi:hypothetical protein
VSALFIRDAALSKTEENKDKHKKTIIYPRYEIIVFLVFLCFFVFS